MGITINPAMVALLIVLAIAMIGCVGQDQGNASQDGAGPQDNGSPPDGGGAPPGSGGYGDGQGNGAGMAANPAFIAAMSDACTGKSSNDTCLAVIDNRAINGTCQSMNGTLTCRFNGRRSGNQTGPRVGNRTWTN